MRRAAWLVPVVFLLGIPVRAADGEHAAGRALLARVVQAMGGAEKLAPLGAVTWKGRGTLRLAGIEAEVADEWSVQGVGRYRWEASATVNDNALRLVLVLNGRKGWIKGNDAEASDLTRQKTLFALLHADFRAVRLAQLPVLLNGPAYRLAPLGELKIGDRPTLGIKVTEKGQPDLDVFVDRETLLPLQAEVRVQETEGGAEMTHTFTFAGYQDVGGVRQATRISVRRDDMVVLKLERSDLRLHESLPADLFEKP